MATLLKTYDPPELAGIRAELWRIAGELVLIHGEATERICDRDVYSVTKATAVECLLRWGCSPEEAEDLISEEAHE